MCRIDCSHGLRHLERQVRLGSALGWAGLRWARSSDRRGRVSPSGEQRRTQSHQPPLAVCTQSPWRHGLQGHPARRCSRLRSCRILLCWPDTQAKRHPPPRKADGQQRVYASAAGCPHRHHQRRLVRSEGRSVSEKRLRVGEAQQQPCSMLAPAVNRTVDHTSVAVQATLVKLTRLQSVLLLCCAALRRVGASDACLRLCLSTCAACARLLRCRCTWL